MCTSPVLLEQWYDSKGNFNSKYFGRYDPAFHTPIRLRCLSFKHHLLGQRNYKIVVVPCGKCEDCSRAKARDWKVRLYHHSLIRGDGLFVTLTYNDEHLEDNQLDYSHYQLFMKRLRKIFSGREIEFFCAGEYGKDSLRRHFHCLIFGIRPEEVFSRFFCRSRRDKNIKIYLSKILEKCWCESFSSKTDDYDPSDLRGYVSVSRVRQGDGRVFGYVSGYIISKASPKHKFEVHSSGLVPEFHHMSLKRPIGKEYYVKYCKQIFDNDFVWFDCRKLPVPKAYIRWYIRDTMRIKLLPALGTDRTRFDLYFGDNSLIKSDYMRKFAIFASDIDFIVDKVSDFDIIKKRRAKYFTSPTSTGISRRGTLYNLDSKRFNFLDVSAFYNSRRSLDLKMESVYGKK